LSTRAVCLLQEELRAEAESQRRRADALDRLLKMGDATKSSSSDASAPAARRSLFSKASSSIKAGGSGGGGGGSDPEKAQELLLDAHREAEDIALELSACREQLGALREEAGQQGRDAARQAKDAEKALAAAKEEIRRAKEMGASAERERAGLLSKVSVYEGRQEAQLRVIAESSDSLAELQGALEEAQDKSGALNDAVLQLNEEVELLSNQKARLAGECEQYAMQVRDLVQATEASETASIATRALRQQIEKLSAHLKQRDEEVHRR
jgi:chromosome segregation ATPase